MCYSVRGQEDIEMDESLDTLWNIGYVEKIAEDGDVLIYAYRFDSQDEEDNGIIQFDRYVLEDIKQDLTITDLIDLFISKRIVSIQFCKNDRLVDEDADLGITVALGIILDSYLEDNSLPKVKEVLNMKAVERMKETYPKGYEEIMKIIAEETKRLTS